MNNYKIVSRILGILTRIGSVFCWIGAVAVALVALSTAIIAPNLKINKDLKEISLFENTISYDIKGKEITVGEGDKKVVIKDGNITVGEDGSVVDVKLSDSSIRLAEEFIENDAMKFIAALPYALTVAFAAIIFIALALGHCASVLKNIADKETPFIEENVDRTEKAAKYFIIALVLTFIGNFILDIVMDVQGYHFDFSSITTILGLYVLVYIFKCGIEAGSKKSEKAEK